MTKVENILERFGNISPIEPSAGWNDRLNQKIAHSGHASGNSYANKIVLFIIIALITLNLHVFSGYWIKLHAQQTNQEFKNIANEFLISTNSSKYK
jgi:hypothetical protein